MVRTDADGFESAQLHLIAMFGAAGQTMGRTIDNCRCQTKHSHIGKTLTIQAIYMTSIPTCTHEETYAAQSMIVQRIQWLTRCSWCVLPIAMHMLLIPNACLHICPFTLCNHEARTWRTFMSRDAVGNLQKAGCFQAARLAQAVSVQDPMCLHLDLTKKEKCLTIAVSRCAAHKLLIWVLWTRPVQYGSDHFQLMVVLLKDQTLVGMMKPHLANHVVASD